MIEKIDAAGGQRRKKRHMIYTCQKCDAMLPKGVPCPCTQKTKAMYPECLVTAKEALQLIRFAYDLGRQDERQKVSR